MTTYTHTPSRTEARWPLYAALGAGTALVLTALGTFWDLNGNDAANDHPLREYAVIAGMILVATAVVFGLVVRGAERGGAAPRAIVLAVLAVPSLVVFWSGLPPVLAAGALACATSVREAGPRLTAMVLAGLVMAASVVLAIIG
jgi:hypothetical protein